MSQLRNLIKDMLRFKVLIVDDKTNMRRTLRNMLRSIGFSNFREAEDGDVALKKLRAERFDFVICDWNMPRLNGVEVLRIMREDERFKEVPFLMITAEVEEDTVAEVLEADVDAYIIKPFVQDTLEDKMAEIMVRKLTPSALDTHLKVAAVFLDANDFAQAHKELDKAVKISARSPRVHYLRGLVFEAQGRMELAEKAFAQAKAMGPKFIKAHEKLAEMYEKKGRTGEMLEVLKDAVRVSPKNANRQTNLGKALLAEGRIQDAKQAFDSAIRLEPDNADRKTAIGEAFLAQGLAQDAEKAFKASIEANPEDIYVYNRLGIAFRRQKKFNEAVKFYRRALAIDPYEENLFYNLARAHLEAGNEDDAIDSLNKALDLQPDFGEARQLLNKIKGKDGSASPPV